MNEEKEITIVFNKELNKALHDISEHPNIMINEADLRSYLYSKFIKLNPFSKIYKIKALDTKTNLLHTEYNYAAGGRYDLAVLCPEDLQSEKELNYKKILIGIELKLGEGKNIKTIYEDIEFDMSAFDKTNKTAKKGFIIHINTDAETPKNQLILLENKLKRLKAKNKDVTIYYIEINEDEKHYFIYKI
ncbi:MAG: hypothetical protein ISS01_02800 [Nanoarchaeota archaeon]|nr:hypothetical protein [Nanoarchaeota archaeon]